MAPTPLTVAVDVSPLHGHRTGVGLAVEHLVAALDRRDDVALEPYLVSFRSPPVAGQRRLPLPAALAMRAWAGSGHPRADRWLRGAAVVHGTNYTVPPSRLPSVVSVYDCWFLTHPELATPTVRRAGRVLRRAVRAGAWVHASSHATAAVARDALGTERVRVVHLGPLPVPDVAARRPDVVDGRPFLTAIGTVERRKDLPTLVAAFGRLPGELADLQLVIAGAPGDDAARLQEAIDQLAADRRGRVHLVGAVDAGTKRGLLQHATALVYPSIDEGFGFPILEAHAAGTPVVATRAGSIPEVGGDAVELARPGDADDLASAIVRVVTDDARRDDLTRAGLRNLDRFSWDATAGGLVELYRAAIEEHR